MEERGSQIEPSPLAATVRAYAVPSSGAPIRWKLDSNEGPGEIGERLAKAIADTAQSVPFHRYPKAGNLEARLAEDLGVVADQVIVTAGGDEALERACRAVLAPGRELILPVPTFEMIGRYGELAGATTVSVDWNTEAYPTAAVLKKLSPRTGVVAIVTPNNPTGGVITSDELRVLSDAARHALLLVDLAYTEFADDDLTRTVLSLPNAVGIRTFSKAWGLAGARIGYAFGPERVLGWMRAVGNPYSVSSHSRLLAEEALRTARTSMEQGVARVRTERRILEADLRELGASVSASQGNFVFFRTSDSRAVWTALAERGFGVRWFGATPRLTDALRVTCPGDEEVFALLREALREALREPFVSGSERVEQPVPHQLSRRTV